MDSKPTTNKTSFVNISIEMAKLKAKELELANYKNDMKYFKVLLKPKNVKQIAVDAEDYHKKIHRGTDHVIRC